MSATGENPLQIIRSGSELSDYLPTWSPDGNTILFNQRHLNARPYVMSVPADDRTDEQGDSFPINIVQIEDLDYSPDGMWLLYEGQDNGENKDILYIPINGNQKIRLTSDDRFDFDPAWRPAAPFP